MTATVPPEAVDAAAGARLVLATRNAHKVVELTAILAAAGVRAQVLPLDRVSATDGGPVPEVAETGETFEENSLLKAAAVARATGLPALADDSGLCVDALAGMPGVLSARWAGTHGADAANLALVLAQTRDVPDGRRGARFVCAASVALPDGTHRVVRGVLAGTLAREPRGDGGFGYDPVFVPQGSTRTLAEHTAQEKDGISHRGRALRALAPEVAALLG